MTVSDKSGNVEAKSFAIHDAKQDSRGYWEYQLSSNGEVYKGGQYFSEADLLAADP